MAKSKPIGVRFDLYKLDMIQKEQNLTSVQQVVNYLMDNYGKNGGSINVELDKIAKKRFKLDDSFVKAMETTKDYLNVVESPKNDKLEPPNNLKGIELAIWKAENWK